MTATLSAAIEYAKRGWAVFPCRLDKTPLTTHGFYDASTDLVRIAQWWEVWPDASIGIATGAVSDLVVLDIDPRHGGNESYEELIRVHGELPETPEALTGGGGRHLYLAHPGLVVPNSAGKLGPGLDVRGDGGYVIAPPSPHPTGKRYEWELSSHPDDVPLAEIPTSILRILQQKPEKSTIDSSLPETITEGIRNETLFKMGCAMRARGFPVHAIFGALSAINEKQCQPPLSTVEVERLSASAGKYEAGELSAVEIIVGAQSNDEEPPNEILQDALTRIFGLPIKRLVQQGVSSAYYSVEFNNGLVPIGDADKFLEQKTWRALCLNHGVVPFARLKENQWLKVVAQLRQITVVEDRDLGTVDWLMDVLQSYAAGKARTWIGEPDEDIAILQDTLPFYRDDLLYLHAGHLQRDIRLTRKGDATLPVLYAALKAAGFVRHVID
jgi:hypothetical protein